jgi:hypothetical protein
MYGLYKILSHFFEELFTTCLGTVTTKSASTLSLGAKAQHTGILED